MTMNSFLLRVVVMLSVVSAAGVADADSSFRCGSKLIAVGMTRSEVLQYCGAPKSKTEEELPVLNGSHQVVGKTMKYRWTYESYSATRVLVFAEDKLASIQ
jgi:hypothetical protein